MPTLVMAGTFVSKTDQPQFQFKANQGDVIWIHAPDCTDKTTDGGSLDLVLLDPKGNAMGLDVPAACQSGRYLLPAAGTYTLKGNVFKDKSGGSYHIPIRFVRPDRRESTSYGQIISGTIGEAAARDVYTFAGRAGDVVQISGPACELSGMFTGIIDPAGHDSIGPVCRDGSAVKLAATGTYGMIVNHDNGGPGAYRFVLQGVSLNGK